MTLIEIIDRQKGVIQEQAAVIAELASMVEQARLTGPGVDDATARAAAIGEEIRAIDAATGEQEAVLPAATVGAAMEDKIRYATEKGAFG